MKQFILFSLVTIMSVGISACSLKTSTDEMPKFQPPAAKSVKGPDLTGTWSSGCQRSTFGEIKSFDVVFTTDTISRKNTTFSDTGCTRAIQSKTEVGTYKYLEANKDGSFTVEYRIPIGGGVSALPQEKLLLDNGVLYLSDYAIGDAITKEMMVPLRKAAMVKVGP